VIENLTLRTRRRLKLSQTRFAALVGVHPITVSKWERGVGSPDGWRIGLFPLLRNPGDLVYLMDTRGKMAALASALGHLV
jgi:DNA-binding transcriptional regulator YiaG